MYRHTHYYPFILCTHSHLEVEKYIDESRDVINNLTSQLDGAVSLVTLSQGGLRVVWSSLTSALLVIAVVDSAVPSPVIQQQWIHCKGMVECPRNKPNKFASNIKIQTAGESSNYKNWFFLSKLIIKNFLLTSSADLICFSAGAVLVFIHPPTHKRFSFLFLKSLWPDLNMQGHFW